MSGSKKPEIITQDGVSIVSLGPAFERITEDLIPVASEAILQAAGGENAKVIIDLGHTQFFGSSFIEAMFRGWNKLKGKPGAVFALAGLTSYCQEVIEITNLNRLWSMYPDRQAAIDALKTK
jgi:anti-sigma B factor antagonist